jgi:hypothetical protein
MMKRPISVTVVGWVYIATGAAGLVYHFSDLHTGSVFGYDALWIELIRLAAVVCGAFLLRGRDWARWAAVAWIGFHVIVSAFHTVPELAMHCLFFAAIVWFLFRGDAARYFREDGRATRSEVN